MTKSEDIAAAANTLLATLATTFGRVATTMQATSAQLTATCSRIQKAKTVRPAA